MFISISAGHLQFAPTTTSGDKDGLSIVVSVPISLDGKIIGRLGDSDDRLVLFDG